MYRELDSDDLDTAYYEKNLPVVEDQLERAGVRLATMLNAVFGQKAASNPVPPQRSSEDSR